jgi:NAD(P)-dependent dehydrogenase (short-subunit alcohol dehydrogenase family)
MATARTEADIQDLIGTSAVVTGASSGLGLEVARALASRGAHVVLAVRSIERGQAAASMILSTNPRASLTVLPLDLSDLASVQRFAVALQSRLDSLNLLVNNAGIASPSLQRTADGFESVFGINHLGHFALTGLLLPRIINSPKVRVVTVSSMAHASGHIAFDNLDGSKGYEPAPAYAQSKLANVLFAYELQRRLSAAGLDPLSVACHPGWAATKMTVGSPDQEQRFQDRLFHLLAMRFAPTAAQAARSILFAATSPEVHGGDYIGPGGRFGVGGNPTRVRSGARSYDEDLARRLWQVSESLTRVRYTFAAARSSGAPAAVVAAGEGGEG